MSFQSGKILFVLLLLIFVIILGGIVVVASWDPPAPTQQVVKSLDAEKLLK